MASDRLVPTAKHPTPRPGWKHFLFRTRLGQLLLALCGIRILGTLGLVPSALTTVSTIGLWLYVAALLIWTIGGLRTKLLWRIRRKLFISYLLIGFVPTVLILSFFALTGYFTLGQVSAYMLSTAVDGAESKAANSANLLLSELQGRLRGGSRPSDERLRSVLDEYVANLGEKPARRKRDLPRASTREDTTRGGHRRPDHVAERRHQSSRVDCQWSSGRHQAGCVELHRGCFGPTRLFDRRDRPRPCAPRRGDRERCFRPRFPHRPALDERDRRGLDRERLRAPGGHDEHGAGARARNRVHGIVHLTLVDVVPNPELRRSALRRVRLAVRPVRLPGRLFLPEHRVRGASARPQRTQLGSAARDRDDFSCRLVPRHPSVRNLRRARPRALYHRFGSCVEPGNRACASRRFQLQGAGALARSAGRACRFVQPHDHEYPRPSSRVRREATARRRASHRARYSNEVAAQGTASTSRVCP